MKLRQKTLLIVNVTLAGLIGAIYLVSANIFMESIRKAEENEAQQTLKGVQNLLSQSQESFSDRYGDWSAWDDTYKFIQDKNPDYIKTNLVPKQLGLLKSNYMAFVNTAGDTVYSIGYDEKQKVVLPIPKELSDRLSKKDDLLLKRPDLTTKNTGIMVLPTGPIWITSQPILTSDTTGPIKGSLIVGRRISKETIEQLSRLARLPLKLHTFNDLDLPPEVEKIRTSLSQKQNIVVQALNEQTLVGYLLIPDIDKKPGFILQVDIPRTTYQQAQSNLQYLIISLIIAGIIFAGVVLFLLERSVLSRVALLISGVMRVRDTNDLGLRLSIPGEDEMSNLTAHINDMLDAIAQSDEKQKQTLAQLADANSKIQGLNKTLRTDNLRMGEELAVTRQLQETILPKPAELTNISELDIAGFMEPASDIGGDYYDVIESDGCIKISIGDVTGHGLQSGILMVMVQSAVRALSAANITNYTLFLSLLNQVIFDNVRRMNSDKNLTIAFLDYKAGKVTLTGQHEEVIIVRADGKIERIDTIDLGFPVGLEADITEFIAQKEVTLFAGDGIVLYTDGLTDAENTAKQQYGIERLCDVLRHNWHHNSRQIQQAVIDDLWSHIARENLQDDVTILVIKQN
jgi:serine phosphatase RsbU (regulator of sigma subunit)/sensor domain CHASE-containing protein